MILWHPFCKTTLEDLNVARGSICHWRKPRRRWLFFCIWKMALLIQDERKWQAKYSTWHLSSSPPHTPLFGSCSCVKREFGSRVLVAQSSSLAKSFNTGLTRDFRSIASWLSVGLCCSAFHHDFQLMIFIKAFISSNITKESVKNHLLAKRSRPLVFLYQVFALISHEREKTKDLPTRVIMKKGKGGPWKV